MSLITQINIEQFKQLFPQAQKPEDFVIAINDIFPENMIIRERLYIALAQAAHESAGFSTLIENLNYSRQGLLKVFKKYFNERSAEQYARKPISIASRVYANRMGNGPESSMDGWKYRGRGIIQITGKNNYTQCSMDLYGDKRLVENPDLVIKDAKTMIEVFCWYWNKNDLNSVCDTQGIIGVTKRINGGINGLVDRQQYYTKIKGLLNA